MAIPPPTASGNNKTIAAGSSIALSQLFNFTAGSGSTVVGFDFEQTTNNGGFITDPNGNRLATGTLFGNTTFGIPISQLGSYHYVASTTGGVADTIAFNVDDADGQFNHTAATAIITSQAAVIPPPTASGNNETIAAGTSIALSQLFNFTAGSGSTVVGFDFEQTTNNGGFITDPNGNRLATGTVFGNTTFGIAISQLGSYHYVASTTGGVSDTIAFNVDDADGQFNHTAATATVTSQAAAIPPPTASGNNETVAAGASIALSQLLNYTAGSGSTVVGFDFEQTTNHGGFITDPNGNHLATGTLFGGTTFGIPISQLGSYHFVASTTAGASDTIAFNVDDADGQFNHTAATATITVQAAANPPPTASGNSQTVAAATSIALSQLFNYTAGSGSTVVGFDFKQTTSNGGFITDPNGNHLASGTLFGNTTFGIPISQLGSYHFVASSAAGASDTIAFNVDDADGQFNHTAAVATVTVQGGGGSGGNEQGIDFQNAAALSASQIAQAGFKFVINYLGSTSSNYLTATEAGNDISAGLQICTVYEVTERQDPKTGVFIDYNPNIAANIPSYFATDLSPNGYTDGANAYHAAINVGQTSGSAIYFAIDASAAKGSAFMDDVVNYFEGIAQAFSDMAAQNPTHIYTVGVYGGGDVIDTIYNAGLAGYKWLADAPSWAGSSGYTAFNIQQYSNGDTSTFGAGAPIDHDVTAGSNFGEWGAAVVANTPPVVTGHNTAAGNGQQIALTTLFSTSGSGITQYRVWYSWPEGGAPALSNVTNNGAPIAQDQWVTVSSLSGLQYVGGTTPGTDKIWVEAYNGQWSNSAEADISDQGSAPVVTGHFATASNGQQIALTSLFSTSGGGITQYHVWYGWPEGGSPALSNVTNNGAAIAQDQWVTVSSLSGLQYVGGTTPGTDKIWVQAFNGQWSNVAEVDIADQGAAPVAHATSTTASTGQQVALTSLFSTSGGGISEYAVWYSWPEGGAPALSIVTNNGTPIAQDQWVIVSSLSGLQYVGGTTPGTDKIWFEAYNGQWSNIVEADITDQGAAPVVTGHFTTASTGQQIALTSLFSASGSGITQYRVWYGWPEGGSPALSNVTNNGTPIAQDQWVTVSSLSGLQYVGSSTPGTDKIWVEAFNGQWSNVAETDIADQGAAPVVTGHFATASTGQQIALTSLFSTSGGGISEYGVWYSWPEGGSPALSNVTNNGTPIAKDQWVIVSSLSGLQYTGSATPGTDKIWVEDFNGQWSNVAEVDIADQGAAPVAHATSTTASNGQQIALSSLFSASGGGISEYAVWYSWPEGGSPALSNVTNNGTPIAQDQWVIVSSLSGLQYTGSSTPGTDKIWFEAYNGQWSNVAESDITDQGAVPVVTAHNMTAGNGQQIALTSLFSASGGGITQYRVWYGWPEGGSPALASVTNNGTPIAQDQWVNVSSLSGLQYTGGATAGTDKIWVEAYNGQWSGVAEADITDQGAAAPVVTAHNATAANGQQIALTSLFSASGSGITQYRVWYGWPEGGSPALASVTNNGTPIAQDQWVNVSSLSGLQYTGGATAGTDKIWVEAYNGQWGNVAESDISDSAGGLTINLVADQSVITKFGSNYQNLPFWQDVQTAAAILDNTIKDHISVTITVGWGTENNQVDSHLQLGGDNAGGAEATQPLGSDDSYSDLKNHLAGTLPSSLDPTTQIFLASAQQKALGIPGSFFEQAQALLGAPDGSIGFGMSSDPSAWTEMALHELTHALGRTTQTYIADGSPTEMDLYRYDSSGDGVLQWTGGSPAYLSINGGLSALSAGGEQARFSTTAKTDFGDLDLVWAPNDSFDAFTPSTPVNSLTALDKEILTVLGFNVTQWNGVLNTSTTAGSAISGGLIAATTGTVTAASTGTVTQLDQSSQHGLLGLST